MMDKDTAKDKGGFGYPLLGDLTALQEDLAAFAHKQWSEWMEYLLDKCEMHDVGFDGCNEVLVIPKPFVERWVRQMKTDYTKLSENEKNSDRKEAAAMIDIIRRHFA